nr:chondroitinase-B domain-containing protein [uncultured Flavobacterium sp.]
MKLNYMLSMAVLCFLGTTAWGQTTVTTDTALQNAVNSSTNGGVFIVPNGTYPDFYCSFTKVATAENPIIIKAQTVGGVTLTGSSYFAFKKAAYITLEGFVFNSQGNSSLVKMEASNNIRLTRNVFELNATSSVKWINIVGTYDDYTFQYLSHHNRVDHNIFKNKTTGGNYITLDGTYNQTRTENYQSQHDRIDHNYFYNNGPRVENEKESIRIGNSQLCQSNGYTIVEFNLFEQCDGDPEIVSVKSCENIIRHNTFNKNYGSLTLRQGNRNRVEGNYFFGGGRENGTFDGAPIYSGGVRVYGTNHVIVNNYFEGLQGTKFDAPITFTQGDAITGVNTDMSLHYRAEDIVVAYNTLVNNAYGIELGFAKQDGSYNKPLKNIVFANNLIVGSQNNLVKYYTNQNGQVSWYNNIMYATGSAQVLTGTTAFTTAQVAVQDPLLQLTNGVWFATSASPTVTAGVATLNISDDIQGQTRPTVSNAGADHYSTSSVLYFPLTPSDVGPDAYEDELPVANVEDVTAKSVLAYPNPTKGVVAITIEGNENIAVTVYNIQGQEVFKDTAIVSNGKLQLDLGNQTPGVYFVKVVNGKMPSFYKIIKQ